MTVMPLSVAIRLGAMLKPKGVGSRMSRDISTTSCAIQAAVEAVGGNPEFMYQEAVRLFPLVYSGKLRVSCPVCGDPAPTYLTESLYHLNDGHRWTREAIADWVETIEQQQPSPDPVAVAEAVQ